MEKKLNCQIIYFIRTTIDVPRSDYVFVNLFDMSSSRSRINTGELLANEFGFILPQER